MLIIKYYYPKKWLISTSIFRRLDSYETISITCFSMKTKFTLVLPESYRVSQSQAESLLQSLTI